LVPTIAALTVSRVVGVANSTTPTTDNDAADTPARRQYRQLQQQRLQQPAQNVLMRMRSRSNQCRLAASAGNYSAAAAATSCSSARFSPACSAASAAYPLTLTPVRASRARKADAGDKKFDMRPVCQASDSTLPVYAASHGDSLMNKS